MCRSGTPRYRGHLATLLAVFPVEEVVDQAPSANTGVHGALRYYGTTVETADRFQGLERPIMLVYHPLSGRSDADAFHLDAGRMCVALSRHRVACFVVSRAGVRDMLLRYAPSGDRVLGIDQDPEYEGWRAQVRIAEELDDAGRLLSIPSWN
jgi:hypothetical protein